MGFVLSYFDWDQAGAERAYARAIALNPNYALARRRYGLFLAVVGRFDEGVAELRRAEELEPLARALRSTFASALFYARRYAEAEALLREQVEMFPESAGARLLLGDVYRQRGRYAEAVAEYRRADALEGGDDLDVTARLALVHAVASDRAEALRLGAVEYLTKPLPFPDFLASVRANLAAD
jgi:tetratricopeptide (TPR) repeat protein